MTGRSFWEEERANVVKTWILFFVLAAIYFGAGLLIDYIVAVSHAGYGGTVHIVPFFTSIAIVAAVIHGMIGLSAGPSMVLSTMRARPANPEDPLEKEFIDVVREISIAAGLPTPPAYVVDTPVPNAFATGKGPGSSVVVATRGLLALLDREELQGVVGHEMGHIRNRDVLTVTVAIVFFGALSMLAEWMLNFWWFGSVFDDDENGGYGLFFLFSFLIFLVAAFFSQILYFAISRTREYLADASSVEFTRNPEGLASALVKIFVLNALAPRGLPRSVAPLYIVSPLAANESSFNLFATHPPIYLRVKKLREMEGMEYTRKDFEREVEIILNEIRAN